MAARIAIATASKRLCTAAHVNPLLADWTSEPFGLPPWGKIEPEHFKPAFEEASTSRRQPPAALLHCAHSSPHFVIRMPPHIPLNTPQAMAAHIAELTAIASNPEMPSFENTCAAFDRAGPVLEQVYTVCLDPSLSGRVPACESPPRACCCFYVSEAQL